MTTSISDNPNALPLDELAIAPQWTKATPKSYDNHPGERAPRPDCDRAPRPRRPAGAPSDRRDRPSRPSGPRRPGGRPQPTARPVQREPQPPPVPPVDVMFVPDEKGFAAMVEAMQHSHRAYALFDVAKLVLNKAERHFVKLSRPTGNLFQVIADESVFLSQDEALRRLLRRPSDKLCREEKKPVEPPKGNFAFVSRCGITGVLFGPPNHHEYQSLIVRHHQRRLRHMPFEDFKARIQTTTDPEAIKQWIESKSFITEYHCLLCAEAKPVATREELEKHVTDAHLAQLITSAPEIMVTGVASRQQPSPGVAEAVRLAWLTERRFPLKTAQTISERLRAESFHFFKHGKGTTYVTFIKPKRFETLDGLSDQIQKIITYLRAYPDSVRKRLAENLQAADADRLLTDLHWLIQEGYVVEFADGKLWALENRPPKPPAAEPVATAAPVPEPVAPPANEPAA